MVPRTGGVRRVASVPAGEEGEDEESARVREQMAFWEKSYDAYVSPVVEEVVESPLVRAMGGKAREVFELLFEHKPLGRGRPMGFSPGKVKLDSGRAFSKWNLPKAAEFLDLGDGKDIQLARFGFEMAPPVTDESLFRFMGSMQEFGSVFSASRESDEKTRHLILARMLQEVLTPYTHLSINIGKKLAGRYAEGPVQFSIGPPTFPPHVPAIIVASGSPSGLDKARGMLFIQLHAAFERNTLNRKYFEKLFGIVTDTRSWSFYVYDPISHTFFESDPIVVNDFFDAHNVEALLCALNQIMAEANAIVSSNRSSDDVVKEAAEQALESFVPFGGSRPI